MKYLSIAVGFVLTVSVQAQNQYFFGLLPALSHTEILNEKAELNLLAASKITLHNRTYGEVEYPARTLEIYLQVQGGYHLNKKVTIAAAYGFQRNNPFTDFFTNEHRLVQQVIWHNTQGAVGFYQRARSEVRFIERELCRITGLRFRYQGGAIVRLSNNRYLNFSEELFLIPTLPRNAVFAENWMYAGAGMKTKRAGHIEAGMVFNSIVFNTRRDVRHLILAQLAWSTSRNWKKSPGPHSAMRHLRQF